MSKVRVVARGGSRNSLPRRHSVHAGRVRWSRRLLRHIRLSDHGIDSAGDGEDRDCWPDQVLCPTDTPSASSLGVDAHRGCDHGRVCASANPVGRGRW